jgi:CheY-like chemotaxis protein
MSWLQNGALRVGLLPDRQRIRGARVKLRAGEYLALEALLWTVIQWGNLRSTLMLVRHAECNWIRIMIGRPLEGGVGCGPAPVLLVVEDEWLIRMDDAEALRAAGWCVLEAASGIEAVGILETAARIDLVLTDMRMPGGVDGLGVLACARAQRPGVPVVLTSGHLDPAIALQAGAAAVLAKPYRLDEMLAIVAALHRRG